MKIYLGKKELEEIKKKDSENENNLLKNRNSDELVDLNEDDIYFNSNIIKNIKLGSNTVNRVYLNNSIVYELEDTIILSKFHQLVPATATSIIFDTLENQYISDYNLVGYCDVYNNIAVYNNNTEYLILNIRNAVIYAPINCSSFFDNYTNLVNIYFFNFDMSNVTNMSQFLQNCRNLLTVDFSNVKSLDNVTSIFQAFYHCQSLSGTLDLSLLNPARIYSIQAAFGDCQNINIIIFRNVNFPSNAMGMYWTFYNCYNLKTIFANKITTNSLEVFNGCLSLVGGNGTKYTSAHIGGDYARIDGENGLPGYFTAPAA